jgi:Fe-S-cluster containining protein
MGGSDVTAAVVGAIRAAARRSEAMAAVASLYADLDEWIEAQRPACVNRGACCRFDDFGHRLYVTTLEAAYFVALHGPNVRSPAGVEGGGCPYQVGGLCTSREGRPVGCRVFFCAPEAKHWQGPATEWALERLRELHTRFEVPYAYVEWREVLRSLQM